jgi:hypothetical protein
MQNGKKLNPSAFKAPPSIALAGQSLVAFKAEKARIDSLLNAKVAQTSAPKAG